MRCVKGELFKGIRLQKGCDHLKLRRFLALFICVVMVVSLAPVTANADEKKEYTVILSPGEGSGAPIVYSANFGEITKTWRDAGNCDFYTDGKSVGFMIDNDYCPDSFTAPEGKSFEKWDIRTGYYTTIQMGTTTFTVMWGLPKYDRDSINNIPPYTGDECYDLGGLDWKLIGKDEERGIGLLILNEFKDMQPVSWSAISELFTLFFTRNSLIALYGTDIAIPTSKAEEKLILGSKLQQIFNNHTHFTGSGKTSTPHQKITPDDFSKKIKIG